MAKGYMVKRSHYQLGDGYQRDKNVGSTVLVFPDAKAIIPVLTYDFAIPKDQVQFIDRIKKIGEGGYGFGEKDIGLEKLGEMSLDEWQEFMKQEGYSDEHYSYASFEADDELVKLLKEKVESSSHDSEINEGVKRIVFS